MRPVPQSELHVLMWPWPFSLCSMDILGTFPPASSQLNYLSVMIIYFTKWVKAEALAKITTTNVFKFFKRNILAKFGILKAIMIDDWTHFIYMNLKTLLKLNIKQYFTSVEHPQTNGKVKEANQVLLRGLKRRLEITKGNSANDLPRALWVYISNLYSTTDETSIRMTYRTKVVILVEV